ncbi:class I SAM-dependent methyltransferase [Streptomyces avidinii]|uniref:class I SAM-dependent methyltransferase n=1 Tax=Streptomyces avidinii TaxID=1895 RepID=UPI0037B16791
MEINQIVPSGPYEDSGRLFTSCADDYVRYRPSHPARLHRQLESVIADGPQPAHLLDLGCGPGTVAIALAERGIKVTAVDASAEMLEAGKSWAAERKASGIEWLTADAHKLTQAGLPEGITGVTIGDAFHWFDRARVLGELDRLVQPGGFVALIGYRYPATPREWWTPMVTQLRKKYLGSATIAGPGQSYIEPQGSHEDLMRRSAFSELTVHRIDYQAVYTLDQIVGVQRTYAYSSPAVLGDRWEDFEMDLRAILSAVQPDGVFRADLQASLIVGRRPHDARHF